MNALGRFSIIAVSALAVVFMAASNLNPFSQLEDGYRSMGDFRKQGWRLVGTKSSLALLERQDRYLTCQVKDTDQSGDAVEFGRCDPMF